MPAPCPPSAQSLYANLPSHPLQPEGPPETGQGAGTGWGPEGGQGKEAAQGGDQGQLQTLPEQEASDVTAT